MKRGDRLEIRWGFFKLMVWVWCNNRWVDRMVEQDRILLKRGWWRWYRIGLIDEGKGGVNRVVEVFKFVQTHQKIEK